MSINCSPIESDCSKDSRASGESYFLAFIFAVGLYFSWSFFFQELSGSKFGAAGSDSYIIVKRILQGGELNWYEQEYISQFGLQGIVLSAVYKLFGHMTVAHFSMLMAQVFSALSAISYSIIVPLVFRRLGFVGVFTIFLILAFSPWMISFSHSLYWALFTLILPFTSAVVFGHMLGGGRFQNFLCLFVVAIIIFIKSLCGYEYITTVTILVCAGYLISKLDAGKEIRLLDLIYIFVACISGFFLAFSVHVMQMLIQTGFGGVEYVFKRILLHSGTDGSFGNAGILINHLKSRPGNEDIIKVLSDDLKDNQGLFFISSFIEYFYLPAIKVGGFIVCFGFFVLLGFAALFRSMYVLYMKYKFDNSYPVDFIWSLSAGTALLAAFSWQVLAWKHMTVHYHLNGLVFSIGLVPLSALWLVALLKKLIPERGWFGSPAVVINFIAVSVIALLVFSDRDSYVSKQSEVFDSISPQLDLDSKIVGNVEYVSVTNILQGSNSIEIPRGLNLPAANISVGGWAYSKGSDAVLVKISYKGIVIGQVKTNLLREDVVSSYKDAPVHSGFSVNFVIPRNINKDEIGIEVVDVYGNRKML